MSKFKIGAKVRCVKRYRDHVIEGRVYTVLDVTGDMYLHVDTGDRIIGVGGYAADRFELVQDEPEYLTPEQVLQYFKEGRQGELERTSPDHIQWEMASMNTHFWTVFNYKWRVKPVPKTIDYYGTELPKNITREEAECEGLTTVYRHRMGLEGVINTDVEHMHKDRLYFRTEADAKLVLDTLLKPFKQ